MGHACDRKGGGSMKKLMKKLLGKKGESLVESLASILIFTLTSIALFSMLMASARINQETKTANEDFKTQMQVAETGDGEAIDGQVTFTFDGVTDGASIISTTKNVDIYQAEGENALYSYFVKKGGGS